MVSRQESRKSQGEAKPLKIVLLGNPATGKTSLFMRFAEKVFSGSYNSTLGVTVQTHQFLYESMRVQLEVWDSYSD